MYSYYNTKKMNTSTLYTFQVSIPEQSEQSEKPESNEQESNEQESNEPKVVKKLVEGTLDKYLKDPDGQSRSIFLNCTVYDYYENSTMPVTHISELYSVPTSRITKYVEGGLEKWTA